MTILKHGLFGSELGDVQRRRSTGQFFLPPVPSTCRQPTWDDKLETAMGASAAQHQSLGQLMEICPTNAQAEAAGRAGARNSVSPSQPRDRQTIGGWPCSSRLPRSSVRRLWVRACEYPKLRLKLGKASFLEDSPCNDGVGWGSKTMVGVGQTQPTAKEQPWMAWVSETRRGGG